jgi:UDP-N-acetylmuramate: L-alanyl-gamma-D-glutamyl-meso-diaminopimelate ligase
MAAVAIDLSQRGWKITGSDAQFYPPMGDLLASSTLTTFRGYHPDNLPSAGLVIVGNAISRGNIELEAALNRNLTLCSLAEFIRLFYLPGKKSLVVSGTHGKTTTTSMLAFVLRELGSDPGWMIGGDPVDLPGPCYRGDGAYFAIEGDEYDTAWFDKRPKFFLYRPYHAILTSVEFDHSDIYPDLDAVTDVFSRMAGMLPEEGTLVVCGDESLPIEIARKSRSKVISYGTSDRCDRWLVDQTEMGTNSATALLHGFGDTPRKLALSLCGRHNLLNALSVVCMAEVLNFDLDDAISALSRFRGVARRLQLKANRNGIALLDDFAHHPTAISLTLQTVRKSHPSARVWAVFEPRSNTMVKNYFQVELENALAHADRVTLGPIHRLDKIESSVRLDVARICRSLTGKGIPASQLSTLETASFEKEFSDIREGDVIVVMSNGAFGGIIDWLTNRINLP